MIHAIGLVIAVIVALSTCDSDARKMRWAMCGIIFLWSLSVAADFLVMQALSDL